MLGNASKASLKVVIYVTLRGHSMDRYRKEVIAEISEPLLDLAKTIAALESRVADARDKDEYRRHDILRGRLLDTYSL